jgi:hypothetical protein
MFYLIFELKYYCNYTNISNFVFKKMISVQPQGIQYSGSNKFSKYPRKPHSFQIQLMKFLMLPTVYYNDTIHSLCIQHCSFPDVYMCQQ